MSLFFRKIESSDGRKFSPSSLILTGVSLVISLVLLGTSASVAWFSMNRKVDSSGMNITVDATPNLIIDSNLETLKSATNAQASTKTETTVDSSVKRLTPATHYISTNTYPVNSTTNLSSCTTGLIYNTNPSSVSSTSGKVDSDKTMYFGDAINTSNKKYFFDYVVYIASLEKPLEISSLDATITMIDNPGNEAYKATSIDFYVFEKAFADDPAVDILNSNYKGTLNLAGIDYKNTGVTVDVLTLKEENNIPVNKGTGAGYIQVIMRVYLDGNLEIPDSEKNYVNSADIVVANLGIKVSFVANEPTT